MMKLLKFLCIPLFLAEFSTHATLGARARSAYATVYASTQNAVSATQKRLMDTTQKIKQSQFVNSASQATKRGREKTEKFFTQRPTQAVVAATAVGAGVGYSAGKMDLSKSDAPDLTNSLNNKDVGLWRKQKEAFVIWQRVFPGTRMPYWFTIERFNQAKNYNRKIFSYNRSMSDRLLIDWVRIGVRSDELLDILEEIEKNRSQEEQNILAARFIAADQLLNRPGKGIAMPYKIWAYVMNKQEESPQVRILTQQLREKRKSLTLQEAVEDILRGQSMPLKKR